MAEYSPLSHSIASQSETQSNGVGLTSRSRRVLIPFTLIVVVVLLFYSTDSSPTGKKLTPWWNGAFGSTAPTNGSGNTSTTAHYATDLAPPSPINKDALKERRNPHRTPKRSVSSELQLDTKAALQHTSSTINNYFNIRESYESMVNASLICMKMGRKDGLMHYYSTDKRACLPYPRVYANTAPSKYVHPADPTLTTVLATVDADGSGPSGSFRSRALPPSSDKVVEKFSPSLHSRWFFEAWRLWEGEVAQCTDGHQITKIEGRSRNMSPQEETFDVNRYIETLPKSDYVTNGEHNASLPSSLYDLQSFCIDELAGSLLSFEEHVTVTNDQGTFKGIRHENLREIKPMTEHVHGHRFFTPDRFLHSSNREAVSLVFPAEGQSSPLSWKGVVSASIEAHHRKQNNETSPPEILFVEDQALIVTTTAFEINNPGHQFHRLGSMLAQARLIGAKSTLVLVDMVAQDPREILYHSRGYLRGGKPTLQADLLPKYLVTKAEAQSVVDHANGTYEPAFGNLGHLRDRSKARPASPAVEINIDAMNGIGGRPVTREGYHPSIERFAAAEALSQLPLHLPFEAEFSPMLATGEEGCEDARCGRIGELCSEDSKQVRRHCNRPYALVNLALAATTDVDHRQYRPDTQNYSTTVWGLAVRETMREAKRLRRDIWLSKKKTPAPTIPLNTVPTDPSAPPTDSYGYMKAWRQRLIDLQSPSYNATQLGMSEQAPSLQTRFEEYFQEYFAYRLETNHYEADVSQKHSATEARPRRQLICYKRAAISHVYHDHVERHNPPGAIGLSTTADCNLETTFKYIYESVWARYGMCQKPEEVKKAGAAVAATPQEPARNSNRDAHPVFLLTGEKQENLRAAFATSKALIDQVLSELEATMPRDELMKLLGANTTESAPRLSAITQAIEQIQSTYDDHFMKYLSWGLGNGAEGTQVRDVTASRPIRLFFAYRSTGSRSLLHWRNHLTALLNTGVGKFLEIEVGEGLAGGVFAPNDVAYSLDEDPMSTARARQYHAYLSTDIFMGPHGADMHSSSLIKPSALTLELASDFYDNTNMDAFRGGYFAAFAYARHTGYLKVMTHRKHIDDNRKDPWEKNHQTYMSLPDLRQTVTVSVCSWLSMNSVRLADEAKSKMDNTTDEAFAHLVPWWCRGGTKPITSQALDLLRERYGMQVARSELPSVREEDIGRMLHFLQPRQLAEQAKYYHPRMASTGYGLAAAVCPPLRPSVTWIETPQLSLTGVGETPQPSLGESTTSAQQHVSVASQARSQLALGSTAIDTNTLNHLQTECAREVAIGHFDTNPLVIRRRFVESLQSILESTLFMGERKAQLVARLIVEGVLAVNGEDNEDGSYRITMPIPIADIGKECGLFPLDLENHEERDGCTRALVEVLVGCNCNTTRSNDLDNNQKAYTVSESFFAFLEANGIAKSDIVISDTNLMKEVVSYIVDSNYYSDRGSVRDAQPALMEASDFSYSWKC